MDPLTNPYSPGAGAPPPELVGRDSVLAQADILLGRIQRHMPEKSILLTGLRGVGKTVLLNKIERKARSSGFHVVVTEAHEGKPLGMLIAPHLRTLLYDLNRITGLGHSVRRAFAVLRSFIGAIKVDLGEVAIGMDVEPEKGSADSGDLEIDLPNLLMAVGEAAMDRSTSIALIIDEVQYFTQKELGALIMAMHKVQQRQLPIVLIGAGLPILPGLAGESKSYAERLFSFPDVGALSASESAIALREPALAAGVIFEEGALNAIFSLTRGYPYFIQEWGYQSWNRATGSPITATVVEDATPYVLQRLDNDFFRVRFNRLTPSEKNLLRAMAALSPGPYRTGEVAEVLKTKLSTIGPVRAKLIKKGMIYSPAHGDLEFTVPLFDRFMIRSIPQFTR